MKKEDRDDLIAAQLKFCTQKREPFKMPKSGKCGRCRVDIVSILKQSMETHVVKNCPKPLKTCF